MAFDNSSNGLANDKLIPYEDEMASLIKTRRDVIVNSAEILRQGIDTALDNRAEKHLLYFGNISADVLDDITDDIPNLPKKLNGSFFKSGRDYSLIASLDSIRHLNESGKLSREDIYRYMDRYADTVLDYDDVHYSEYTDSYGNKINGLRFRKNYPDGIQVAYDIVSNKKRALALQTDFSKKIKKSASTLLLQNTGATTPSNGVTTPKARGSQTSINTLPQPSAKSNTSVQIFPSSSVTDQYQRADNLIEDTEFEIRARDNRINELMAENKVLEEAVTKLKQQAKKLGKELKLSRGPQETRLSDARKLTGEILKETGSSQDAKAIARRIKEIGEYLSESADVADYKYLRSLAVDIARDIVSDVNTALDDGTGAEELRNDFKAALRNRTIYVP